MRRIWYLAAFLAAAAALVWYFDRDILHFLGWDGQTSDNYAAWSGSVPALIALGGYGSLVASVLHQVNCHEKGCLRIGRHRIGSGVWCQRHHENARPDVTDSDRLALIHREIAALREMLDARL